jgi:hypothetical protein
MTIEKLLYLLTPPAVTKILQKLAPQKKTLFSNKPNAAKKVEEELKSLREMKFNYFMKDEVIEEFCDYMIRDNQDNSAIEPTDKENLKYVQEIEKNGVCKISGLIDPKIVDDIHKNIHNYVLPFQERMESLILNNGEKSGKNISETYDQVRVDFELDNAIMRFWGIQKINSSIKKEFLENTVINDVCKSYLGGTMNENNVYAEYKYKKNLLDPNVRAHMDSPFKMIKVFLLLNDISIKNAPFSYYKKSHIFNQWRILKDLLEFSQCNKKYYSAYGNYGDIELNNLMKNYPEFISSRIDMTGKAGDVIISDNRGIHQGNVLYDGYRLQLGMVFGPLGDFDIGNIPKYVTKMVRSSK